MDMGGVCCHLHSGSNCCRGVSAGMINIQVKCSPVQTNLFTETGAEVCWAIGSHCFPAPESVKGLGSRHLQYTVVIWVFIMTVNVLGAQGRGPALAWKGDFRLSQLP